VLVGGEKDREIRIFKKAEGEGEGGVRLLPQLSLTNPSSHSTEGREGFGRKGSWCLVPSHV